MYKSEREERQWKIAELSEVLNVNYKDIEVVDMYNTLKSASDLFDKIKK